MENNQNSFDEKVREMDNEELAKILSSDASNYQTEFLELVKEEVGRRGLNINDFTLGQNEFIQPELANEWVRFGAKLLDNIILVCPILLTVIVEWSLNYFGGESSLRDVFEENRNLIFGFGGLWLFLFGIFQIVFLSMKGQTLGKKIFGIKIVKREGFQNGGFVTNIILRAILNGILGFVPLYGFVDSLFIFTQENRCIHDLIAGTIVIKDVVKSEVV